MHGKIDFMRHKIILKHVILRDNIHFFAQLKVSQPVASVALEVADPIVLLPNRNFMMKRLK